MSEPSFPKSWKKSSKPHKFCPGCGQALALKNLGFVIDQLQIADRMVYGCDIGCSLLTWDMFEVDTIQTHHGRVLPTIVGFKLAKPSAITLAFMGDGGGYAIGAQHLVNAVMRDDPVTIILVNNANYAMTGGQMAPTTLVGQHVTTAPNGRDWQKVGAPIHGPEMLSVIASENTYIARTISTDINDCREKIRKALQNQIDGRGISFVEIISMCPINWHTNTIESLTFSEKEMTKVYPLGEFKCPQKLL